MNNIDIKPKKIKISDREIVVRIEKFAMEGTSIAHDDEGKVVFVRYVLPKELVRVKVYRESKDYAMAEPLEILEASPQRVDAPCSYFTWCGGCDYQMVDKTDQLKIKKELIEELFRRHNQTYTIDSVVESPKSFHYRNNMTYKVNPKKKTIGFFRKDSKSIVSIDSCLLEMPSITDAFRSMKEQDTEEHPFPKHDFKVRSTTQNETSIYWVPSYKYSNSCIHESIQVKQLKLRYRISKDSFFQVNSYVVPKWLDLIISFLSEDQNEKIVDLYCGIGLITLAVSFYAKKTIGIEISQPSIIDAKYNLEINDISDDKVSFILGDAGECLKKINSIDIIIVNPPRSGLNDLTRSLLLEHSPKKIIYSSCKPSTMVRDINLLSSTYRIKEMHMVDMFPQTHHIELLVLLVKK